MFEYEKGMFQEKTAIETSYMLELFQPLVSL